MFEQIWDLIKKNDSIVIYGHINPDGDCYGAQIGLKEIILSNLPDKKVYVTGSGVPPFFDVICKMDEVDDETIKNSLAIIVDGNDLARMEDSRIFTAKEFAKIDHHIDTGSFTEGPFIVDVDANSTCDIITGLVIEHNLKLNKLAANALFLGILTDSARFQFVSNFPQTFERAKFLCEHGANPNKINRVLSKSDEISLAAKGYVMSHYKKSPEGVISIVLDRHTLKELNISANHASNLINLLGNIEGYPIWCSFAEYADGRVRAEFRSNGPQVQPVAVSVGGGGHAHASGAQLKSLDYDQIDVIIRKLDQAIIDWRKK